MVFPPTLLPSWDLRSLGYRGRHILQLNGMIISLPLPVPASLRPPHSLSARGCLLVKSSLAAALYFFAESYWVTLGCCVIRDMCWVVRNLYKRIKTYWQSGPETRLPTRYNTICRRRLKATRFRLVERRVSHYFHLIERIKQCKVFPVYLGFRAAL